MFCRHKTKLIKHDDVSLVHTLFCSPLYNNEHSTLQLAVIAISKKPNPFGKKRKKEIVH
uniref:Uncharacterized protein n=1 Tax=Anguilla anguilla TaxID=7936 RepID=A0A0E9QAD6_ANGAN